MKNAADRSRLLAEKVRNLIIDMVHYSLDLPSMNYSEYISKNLCVNYTLLSKSFSKSTGITIEQFIIREKIERVKNLLSGDENSISEIAWKLHYSSTAHLSAQFKKITGVSPSVFRKRLFED